MHLFDDGPILLGPALIELRRIDTMVDVEPNAISGWFDPNGF